MQLQNLQTHSGNLSFLYMYIVRIKINLFILLQHTYVENVPLLDSHICAHGPQWAIEMEKSAIISLLLQRLKSIAPQAHL